MPGKNNVNNNEIKTFGVVLLLTTLLYCAALFGFIASVNYCLSTQSNLSELR